MNMCTASTDVDTGQKMVHYNVDTGQKLAHYNPAAIQKKAHYNVDATQKVAHVVVGQKLAQDLEENCKYLANIKVKECFPGL